MALVTQQQLSDAATDAASLAAFVNNASGTITTRLGRVLKVLAQLQQEVSAIMNGIAGSVRVTGTTGAIRASTGGIVSSVTRNGVGSYTVTIPTVTAGCVVTGSLLNMPQFGAISLIPGAGYVGVSVVGSVAPFDCDFSLVIYSL